MRLSLDCGQAGNLHWDLPAGLELEIGVDDTYSPEELLAAYAKLFGPLAQSFAAILYGLAAQGQDIMIHLPTVQAQMRALAEAYGFQLRRG